MSVKSSLPSALISTKLGPLRKSVKVTIPVCGVNENVRIQPFTVPAYLENGVRMARAPSVSPSAPAHWRVHAKVRTKRRRHAHPIPHKRTDSTWLGTELRTRNDSAFHRTSFPVVIPGDWAIPAPSSRGAPPPRCDSAIHQQPLRHARHQIVILDLGDRRGG